MEGEAKGGIRREDEDGQIAAVIVNALFFRAVVAVGDIISRSLVGSRLVVIVVVFIVVGDTCSYGVVGGRLVAAVDLFSASALNVTLRTPPFLRYSVN